MIILPEKEKDNLVFVEVGKFYFLSNELIHNELFQCVSVELGKASFEKCGVYKDGIIPVTVALLSCDENKIVPIVPLQ